MEKANYPVAVLCRVLEVKTSTFYDWRARRYLPSARSMSDATLTAKIQAIHTMSRHSYGGPTRLSGENGFGFGADEASTAR